jgi:hypothetical protein
LLKKFIAGLLGKDQAARAELAEALRFYETGNIAAAASLCTLLLAATPESTDAWALSALCHDKLGDSHAARQAWLRVLELAPAHAEARAATVTITEVTGLKPAEGETEAAFAMRLAVARELIFTWGQRVRLWKAKVWNDPRLRSPMWDGGELTGKRLLVHSIGGFGDAIHFARYSSWLAACGATVHVECRPPLTRILASCPGIAAVTTAGAKVKAADYDLQTPQITLLKHFFFQSLQRGQAAYLSPLPADVEAWAAKFAGLRGLRVGINWAGNPGNKNDARRSMALADLLPLFAIPGIEWISLQRGSQEGSRADPLADPQVADAAEIIPGFHDWTSGIEDFADSAALISHLDLVVAVNSAVAHLAGAIGKPVWVLYSNNEDRRWDVVADARQHYAQARIFKQSTPGDWKNVVAEVAVALGDAARAHSPRAG